MNSKITTKPLYYISKTFCTTAFDLDTNNILVKSNRKRLYILRIFLYVAIFIVGNFFTNDVIGTGSLDEIAFLLANVLLISLTIYLMIWSITSEEKQIKLLNKLQDENVNYVVWIELITVAIYITSVTCVVMYKSDYDILLVVEYFMFFILPDVFIYTVVFKFINTVLCLEQKFYTLNSQISLQDITFLAKTYQDLYFLSVKASKLFGFICLWTVAAFFMWIMCDMYRFVNIIIVGSHKVDATLVSSLVATTFHYLAILSMAAVCSSTKKESQRFNVLFSRRVLESGIDHLDKKKKICITLKHQKVNFTALDWFEVDYLLFYSMTGSIITYLVVLQQLDL